MQELTFEQVEVVSGGSKIEDMRRAQAAREADKQLNGNDGGGLDGCTLPSLGTVASGFGAGYGAGGSIGAATGYSASAALGAWTGLALAGAGMLGYSIGVGINHAIGACD